MNKLHDHKLAIPTIAAGLDKRNWSIIKQMIYSEFKNCNIELIICYKTLTDITNSWRTREHEKIINLIHDHYFFEKVIKGVNNINDNYENLRLNNYNINNKMNNKNNDKIRLFPHSNQKTNHTGYNNKNNDALDTTSNHKYNIDNNDYNEINIIFNNYKPGENVKGDGNCGLYAICNALNDNKDNRITSIGQLLELLQLSDLPGHWFSDNELASIANYYNHNTYIFDENTKTAIIYRDKNIKRPQIVLYNTNNTHWIPGVKSIKPSFKIPNNYIEINDITPLEQIITKIKQEYKFVSKSNIIDNELKNIEQIQIKKTHSSNKSITTNSNLIDNKEILYDNENTPINISHELNISQHKQAIQLLKKYLHLFTSDASNIKSANVKPCEIKLKPNYKDPKFHAPHRVSPQQRDELKTQLDKLNKAGIIRPIISKFAAPAFLVKKKEKGSYRLVVSYKELNERVETDQYPIPRTSDLLRALEGATYFTSLDLNSGFFQLPVREEDQHKLAFTSVHGLMTFTRLPQGFKNSSAIFQRTLNEAFSALLYKSIVIYIDDLASYGKNFNEALVNLEKALKIIDLLNFSLKTTKCHFFNNKIQLLGHIISRDGTKPTDTNTKAITEFKQPKTQKDVRSFIGMCSYYRKHVKDFAKIAHPLTELTKGDTKKIIWNDEHEQSFNQLKHILTSKPVLNHFNDEKEVYLTIDASLLGVGACLEQCDKNNILRPIGYASRKLLKNEKTYSSTTL
ncbi:Reverse transcriptase domain [Cinara cedri]|uniref:RNA-directed DNA polymerase n=1 Tax=Cinara cedri TaxID=506608 RepID=A0A5E4N8S0_9HEMI|nr:Reverse transcriptase domain [Cinara cedri]